MRPSEAPRSASGTAGRTLKGRTIWGGLNPWDKVWRLGADEATTLTTDRALEFGAVRVPAGKHTLYMWVSEKEPQLIINKQTGQWGTEYEAKQDSGSRATDADIGCRACRTADIGGRAAGTGWGFENHLGGPGSTSAPFTVGK